MAENKATEGSGVDITPKQDGGVLKEILREGTADEKPLKGNKVFVHYVGTLLDGTQFDSSRDRGEQFSFTLGQGQVIQAWDIGIASMKRGELARLTCRGDYAYKEAGSPPKIGPNATLIFEVELFDWKGEDISEDKDEGVLRTMMIEGDGYLTPNNGATCEIHVRGILNGRVFQEEDIAFIMGEASEVGIVPGVETAVKKFKKGEQSHLQIKAQYAYGATGCAEYNIPPNTDLTYEITLNKFEKAKESWEMDVDEKLEQSEIAKSKGTAYFKEAKYQLAVRYYEKVVDYLGSEESITDGDKKTKRVTLLLAAHLNMAMAHLKTGDNNDARQQCNKALEYDARSEKAFFRRGTASMNCHDYEDAVKDFQEVLKIDANNKAAKNQLVLCQHHIKQEKDKERQTYKGMFTKFAEIDAKKAKLNPEENVEKKVENGESGGNSDSSAISSEDEVAMETSPAPGSPAEPDTIKA